jgi:hypothetical protein
VQRKKAAAKSSSDEDPASASRSAEVESATSSVRRPKTDDPTPSEQGAEKADVPLPTGGVVDRDSLTEAWGDSILRALPARAKALFSAGRFVSVDEEGAHFALPNTAHRDRCAEMVRSVEEKLSAHFDTPVTLILDVDGAASPSGGAPVRSSDPPSGGGGPGPVAHGDDDPSEYADSAEEDDAGDQALEAEARLLQAFPGASEVSG